MTDIWKEKIKEAKEKRQTNKQTNQRETIKGAREKIETNQTTKYLQFFFFCVCSYISGVHHFW